MVGEISYEDLYYPARDGLRELCGNNAQLFPFRLNYQVDTNPVSQVGLVDIYVDNKENKNFIGWIKDNISDKERYFVKGNFLNDQGIIKMIFERRKGVIAPVYFILARPNDKNGIIGHYEGLWLDKIEEVTFGLTQEHKIDVAKPHHPLAASNKAILSPSK